MQRVVRQGLLAGALMGCAKPGIVTTSPCDAICEQRAQADRPGPDQTLERARLASLALAAGQRDVATDALESVVAAMQSALENGEKRRPWTGDPSEQMMAFVYLGLIELDRDNPASALELAAAAIAADTGPEHDPYRADFVAAHLLAALAHHRLGDDEGATADLDRAIDALYVRELTETLSEALHDAARQAPVADEPGRSQVAHALLQSALPAALLAHPRDPALAIQAAQARAEVLRYILVEEPKRTWPDDLKGLSRGDGRSVGDAIDRVTETWLTTWPPHVEPRLAFLRNDEAFLSSLLTNPPQALLWFEAGRAPDRLAIGRYGETLQLVDRDVEDLPPEVLANGRPLDLQYVDSVAFQAMTRGSRRVDRFRKGQAMFKDTAWVLGEVLATSGDIVQFADAVDGEFSEGAAVAAGVLYIAAGVTWLAGALTNPQADTRAWDLLPDTLWLARIDQPGSVSLAVDGQRYTVHTSKDETLRSYLVPALPPGGPRVLGTPSALPPVDGPLALPAGR